MGINKRTFIASTRSKINQVLVDILLYEKVVGLSDQFLLFSPLVLFIVVYIVITTWYIK